MQTAGKGLSITGIILGIIAMLTAWISMVNIASLIIGIIGIVCAAKGLKAAREAGDPTSLGTAGLVLSIIGTCLAGLGFLTCTLCVLCAGGIASSMDPSELEQFSNQLDEMVNEYEDLRVFFKF